MGREECSVKCEVWRKQWEVRSVKCGMWSVKCGVWTLSLECEERSVKCEVWSARFGVWRKQWEVRSVKCGLWSVKCGVWSVKCGVWSVKCAWSVKFEVWSAKRAVWSVECGVWRLCFVSRWKKNGCRGKDTVGTGCLWTIGHLFLGNFRRRLARVYVMLGKKHTWYRLQCAKSHSFGEDWFWAVETHMLSQKQKASGGNRVWNNEDLKIHDRKQLGLKPTFLLLLGQTFAHRALLGVWYTFSACSSLVAKKHTPRISTHDSTWFPWHSRNFSQEDRRPRPRHDGHLTPTEVSRNEPTRRKRAPCGDLYEI